MLASLHIENIAVIRSVDMDLSAGFTVLTGETGAGKSIIIDAIALLLGGKVQKDLIRTGEEEAMVSGLFTDLSPRTVLRLAALGISPDEEGNLFIQRSVRIDGKSRTRMGGRSIPTSLQRQVMAELIDIHGQHDNQKLLSAANHLEILDDFAEVEETRAAYRAVYDTMCEIKKEMTALSKGEREKERLCELLRYQIADIDAIKPMMGEEEELEAKRRRIKDGEKLRKHAELVSRALYRNEKGMSASDLIAKAASSMRALAPYLPEAEAYAEKLNELRFELADMGMTAGALCEGEGGEEELDRIEERLHELGRLKRKYGADMAEVLAFRERAQAELDGIAGAEERLADLTSEWKKVHGQAEALASALHEKREEMARVLEERVLQELRFLEMPKVRFSISIRTGDENGKTVFKANGIDSVEFLISANPGEPLKPLDRIASGGELSRIMLAIKSAGADKGTETMIFDEIDTGISGKTSQRIGVRLRRLGEQAQVLCITHSAQIAAVAHEGMFISKHEVQGRTETRVQRLDHEARVEELARIMGGAQMTANLRSSARELLEEYNPLP